MNLSQPRHNFWLIFSSKVEDDRRTKGTHSTVDGEATRDLGGEYFEGERLQSRRPRGRMGSPLEKLKRDGSGFCQGLKTPCKRIPKMRNFSKRSKSRNSSRRLGIWSRTMIFIREVLKPYPLTRGTSDAWERPTWILPDVESVECYMQHRPKVGVERTQFQ